MAQILTDWQDGYGVLTLDRPDKHNALDPELAGKLIEVLETLADPHKREAVDVLIVTGTGSNAFCAGADLRRMSEMTHADLHAFLVQTRRLFRGLAELEIPTIAAVNGHAHGAGAEIACICDFRIGCPQTTFRFPGLAYGMAVGTWHLPSVVGLPKAKELLLTTDQVDAEESMRIGLLNQLVPATHLLERAKKMALRISRHPQEAVRGVKALLNRTVGAPLQQSFYRELYSNQEWRASRDPQALFRSFFESQVDDNGDEV